MIKHVKTKKEEVVHFNRLKRAHADTDTLNNYLDNICDDTNTDPQIQDTDNDINIQSEDEAIIIAYRAPPPPLVNRRNAQIARQNRPDVPIRQNNRRVGQYHLRQRPRVIRYV